MYTIDNSCTNEIVINKSRFICKILPINDIDVLNKILKEVQNEYKSATHYCYAYIIGNKQKYCDDGEPSGTAGLPIFNVLQKKELCNVIAIVIRYFGGIKLGAGGLLRAYTKAVTDCLEKCDIIPLKDMIDIQISINYNNLSLAYNLINDEWIQEKIYDDDVILKLRLSKDEYNQIKDSLEHISNKIL